jgi:uncharacterized protein
LALSAYLDTSVLVALFMDDPFAKEADLVVRALSEPAIVSDFASAEAASTIARRVRKGEMTRVEARDAFDDMDLWTMRSAERIEAVPEDVRMATAYLRRLDLTLRAPDAIHIATAQRLGAELATFDTRMAECARALGAKVLAI